MRGGGRSGRRSMMVVVYDGMCTLPWVVGFLEGISDFKSMEITGL